MLAFGLVDSLARLSDRVEIFRYAAGGFRDFTRIASSDPLMWKDICIANADALLEALKRFETDMQEIHGAVERRDAERLLEIFARAKAARDEFVD
jgi:prephenate dehydrogenase